MSTTNERINIVTNFEASQAVSEIQRLSLANQNLNAQLEQVNRKTKEGKAAYRELTSQIKANSQVITDNYKTLGNAGLNSKQLANKISELKKEYKALIPAAAGYDAAEKALRTEIIASTKALDARNAKLLETEGLLTMLKKQSPSAIIGGIGGGIAALLLTLVTSFGTIVSSGVASYAKLSDTLSNMQKSTGLAKKQVEELNSSLSNVDTRTAKSELQDIVIVAGQMGIASEQILGFTKATDKLNVALGDEFKGGAEQITNVFGSLRNVLVDMKTNNVSEDMLHLGNAVNVLGAAGQATGPVITDIANRIGSAGTVYGLTAGQTLGLAAAYQELAISTERGSTATVKILDKMSAAPEMFATVAGMSAEKFKTLVNTNIGQALLEVSKGFASSKGSATEFAEKLADAEISSAAISEVLAKVGQNTELVSEKMNLATEALKSTGSIMEEFNIKNENFAAQQEKAGKVWDKWVASLSSFVSALARPAIKIMASFGKASEDVTERFVQQRKATDALVERGTKLIERYNALTKEAKTNKNAQADLKTVIAEIASITPTAGKNFDLYGNAMTVNTNVLANFITKQKEASKALKDEAVTSLVNKNNALLGRRAELFKDLNSKNSTIVNALQLANVRKELAEINKQIVDNRKTIKEFQTGVATTDEGKGDKKKPPVTTTTTTDVTKEEQNRLENLRQKRIENHARTLAELTKMEIEEIDDSYTKKEAGLQEELRLFIFEKQKEVKANELLKDDADKIILAKTNHVNKQIEDMETEREKKLYEATLKHNKSAAEVDLKEAENTGDEQTILAKKIALNIVEEQLAIATAGEEQWAIIHRNYAAERAKFEIDLTKKTEDEKAKTRKTYEDAREEYEKKQAEDRKKRDENTEESKANFKRKIGESVANVGYSLLKNSIDKELSDEEAKYQRLTQLNEDQLAQGVINNEQYNAKKIALEEQHDQKVRQLKRKQAIFDKAKAILDIAINTASGVVRAASGVITAGMIPWIIATGAIEAAAVAATPIPQFQAGGFTDTNSQYATSKPTPQAKLIWANEQGAEFISNNTAVRHPVFPYILPILEQMNQGKNVEMGSLNSMNANVNTTPQAQQNSQLLIDLKGSIDRLNYNLENPIAPNLNVGYKTAKDILDAATEVDTIINNVSAL